MCRVSKFNLSIELVCIEGRAICVTAKHRRRTVKREPEKEVESEDDLNIYYGKCLHNICHRLISQHWHTIFHSFSFSSPSFPSSSSSSYCLPTRQCNVELMKEKEYKITIHSHWHQHGIVSNNCFHYVNALLMRISVLFFYVLGNKPLERTNEINAIETKIKFGIVERRKWNRRHWTENAENRHQVELIESLAVVFSFLRFVNAENIKKDMNRCRWKKSRSTPRETKCTHAEFCIYN